MVDIMEQVVNPSELVEYFSRLDNNASRDSKERHNNLLDSCKYIIVSPMKVDNNEFGEIECLVMCGVQDPVKDLAIAYINDGEYDSLKRWCRVLGAVTSVVGSTDEHHELMRKYPNSYVETKLIKRYDIKPIPVIYDVYEFIGKYVTSGVYMSKNYKKNFETYCNLLIKLDQKLNNHDCDCCDEYHHRVSTLKENLIETYCKIELYLVSDNTMAIMYDGTLYGKFNGEYVHLFDGLDTTKLQYHLSQFFDVKYDYENGDIEQYEFIEFFNIEVD